MLYILDLHHLFRLSPKFWSQKVVLYIFGSYGLSVAKNIAVIIK